jgi:hypothetical protein
VGLRAGRTLALRRGHARRRRLGAEAREQRCTWPHALAKNITTAPRPIVLAAITATIATGISGMSDSEQREDLGEPHRRGAAVQSPHR